MLDKIIRFSIQNKLIIGLLTVVLIAWGGYSATQLPIDAVPDITDNQVMIITTSPTLAAQEVEQLVTFPIEQTMVSIPNIDEMRSFSRFGLSIVTIVFKEDVDLYWARQQVQERLNLAAKEIPSGVGIPEMAPVTTGLGEIYQYVVHTKEGYEDRYDATELRSIQDWIIKRQLLGTPGVADVSGFGGHVKQYQVALKPDLLKSMDVSINEVFQALENNNQNTGGAYIDKNPYAYFIRSEGFVNSLEEIGEVVVKTAASGTPILIRDLAEVQFGHGVRYGAATRNSEGEVVTGIVMMLKGANSSEVINNVKAKIEQIKTTLPEGVVIEPYLDRKKLVDGAIGTVSKNLLEGALIVLFVLILFLGNIRGGIVVASVIPLAMLFALGMMRLFGVSGNLMSLGAIDFGLIVDGTVIIVEAVMFGIIAGRKKYPGIRKLTQTQMDEEVYNSSSKIRTSAAFGEIIILIVYLPLWALSGVEGKMFTPMAQTVSFAILGAFILSLTYIPMMSALMLSKRLEAKPNFSDKMMDFFQNLYSPVIRIALKRKAIVLFIAIGLFLTSLFTFSKMGGEFIPQLDEGDFAVETRVPVGSSIQQSIAVSQKAQRIILDNFQEALQVVSKIGSGEIPTDPMPIEAGDMMIILKPRNEWVNASTREELAEKMQAALAIIPDASFSFQQPIQMRFNELLTGAKQDVVIKIYGEDLNTLKELSEDVGARIAGIEGVNDLYVEEITGLPQIQIKYNRDQIARYGLNVKKINQVVRTGFAGESAGTVYEGERRFELAVRLTGDVRQNISDVKSIFIDTPQGNQIPLSEVAKVEFAPGPIQIQRDDAKRRVIIGYNVRGRDVKSTVEDIQEVINKQVSLPSGYYITYGGQFKNLQAASKRLSIALPIAILLILVLLYFTFSSIKQSLLIFSAIPLSAIGGIFALFIRDMPFSISAGVGFIALFGVSVLNGIVLIAEFNSLKKEGISDIYERVIQGTRHRLRPVLMTAMVASMGFLPMAISTTAGAEVQRPLATVVIGGLISATLLTLVVLPVLYIYFSKERKNSSKGRKSVQIATTMLVLMGFPSISMAQNNISSTSITLEDAVETALQNNPSVKMAVGEVERMRALQLASWDIPKTSFSYSSGEINTPGVNDEAYSITQEIAFPSVYLAQKQVTKSKTNEAQSEYLQSRNLLIQQVKDSYWQLVYLTQKEKLLRSQTSLYSKLSTDGEFRLKTGETNYLEMVNAQTKAMQIRKQLQAVQTEKSNAQRHFQTLLGGSDQAMVKDTSIHIDPKLAGIVEKISFNPALQILKNKQTTARRVKQLSRHQLLPDLSFAYNLQSFGNPNGLSDGKQYSNMMLGISIPIFSMQHFSQLKATKLQEEIAAEDYLYTKRLMETQLQNLQESYRQQLNMLEYYEKQALQQANLIIRQSQQSWEEGAINYISLVQNFALASDIQKAYLDELLRARMTANAIESLIGNEN